MGEGPLIYRTNTDLEESILRLSGKVACFFLTKFRTKSSL